METVALLTGEPFSDVPSCAHPAIRALATELNDVLDDAMRQRLLAFVPRISESAETLAGVDVFSRFRELCRHRVPPSEIRSVRLRHRYQWALSLPTTEEKACDLMAGTAVLRPATAIAMLDELLPGGDLDAELTELGRDPVRVRS
jgi:hypothetical protein